MSEDIATLGIKVDSTQADDAAKSLDNLANSGDKAEGSTKKVAAASDVLKRALAGLGIAALAREAVQLADTYNNIQGRLSLVTSGTANLAAVTNDLFQIAQRTRVGFQETADLYASLARSTEALGVSQGDLKSVTETINKALVVSGASAETAAGALTQLGQGFASGALRGDELNAVLEGTPRLARAIADGMKVTVGELRSLGAEGKITGEAVFKALLAQREAVDKEFAKMPVTVGQSLVVLRNEILKFVGETDDASGASGVLAAAVKLLADNLGVVVPAVSALAVALGVGFVTSAVAARLAAVQASASMIGMAGAARAAGASMLAAFGGPIGIAITGLTIGLGAMYSIHARNQNVIDTVNRSYKEMRDRLNEAKTASDQAASGSTGVGSAANGAIPGVDSLSGSVRGLANQYYRAADAAKKARIEMAATALADAQKNERAASELTAGARNQSGRNFVRGDFLNNASVIGNAIYGGARSLLSGGRTDREAADTYSKAVAVTVQAKKDLASAYTSSNSAVQQGTAETRKAIAALKGDIGELEKIRGAANAKERKRIDSEIAEKRRAIKLTEAGGSASAISTALSGGGGSGKTGKTDAQRETERATEASKKYVEQLQNETSEIGKNDVEVRLAAAAREAAQAPTKALASSILAAADAWAAETIIARARNGVNSALKEASDAETKANTARNNTAREMADNIAFENKLLGMNAQQRAVAVAKRNLDTAGIREGTDAYDLYGKSILEAASAQGELDLRAEQADAFADAMADTARNVRDASDALGGMFGKAGRGFADLVTLVADYGAKTSAVNAQLADEQARYGKDTERGRAAQVAASKELARLELNNTGKMLGAAKGFFKEKSVGYKALEAAEKAYRAIEFAMSVRSMVQDAAATIRSVLNSTARATAKGAEGVAEQSKLPFPANIAAMAATAAALVAAGVAVFGGGGGGASASLPTSEDRQKAQGTGSVLGDTKSASESIARSLEIAASNTNKELEYSNQMVKSLRAIEGNIGSLSSLLARQLGLTGGAFDQDKLNLGTSTKGVLGGTPLVGGLLSGLLGSKKTTTTLNDQGLDFNGGSVAEIVANGITADVYQELLKTTTKSSLFGLSKSTKTSTSTVTSSADDDLTKQVSLLIGNLKSSIVEAAGTIGIDGAGAMLDAFQVNIGKISLKDMTGEEIEDALNGVFSKLGDDMVSAIYGDIAKFQKVGEGSLETIVRLGRQYQVVDVTLQSIGKTFGIVGIASLEARQRLVDLVGGLDELTEQTQFYRENFLSEAEQMSPVISAVANEMARLGLSGVTTKEAFKQVVQGLDLSSAAGAEMYAALLAVAPAFVKVSDYATDMIADTAKALQEAATAAQAAADKASQNVDAARGVLQNSYNTAVKAIEETTKSANDAAKDAAANVETARGVLKASYDAAVSQINANAEVFAAAAEKTAASLETARGKLQATFDRAIADATATLTQAQSLIANSKNNIRSIYDTSMTAIDANVSKARDAVTAARSALTDAYRNENSAINATIDRFKAFRESLKAFRNELNGTQLSQLSPENAYMKAKADFADVSARARGGDQNAMGQLETAGKALLDASENYNASSAAYQSDLAIVKSAVDAAIAATGGAESNAEAQLSALNSMVGGLITVNDSVLSVADALKALETAEQAQKDAETEAERQRAALRAIVGSYIELNDTSLSLNDNIANLLSGQKQEALAQSQIDALNKQLAALIGTDNTLLSIDDATQQFLLALRENDIAQAAAEQAKADAALQIAALDKQTQGLLAANDNLKSVDQAIAEMRATIATNETAQSAAAQAAADASAQLAALDANVAGLLTVNASVVSVAAAIEGLGSAIAAQAAAQAAATAAAAAVAAQASQAAQAAQATAGAAVRSVETIQAVAAAPAPVDNSAALAEKLDEVVTELRAANLQRGAGNEALTEQLGELVETNNRGIRIQRAAIA